MPATVLVDIAGRRRSPATLRAFHAGRPPHNKGLRYPGDFGLWKGVWPGE